jgi:enoyl-CoA hydratase
VTEVLPDPEALFARADALADALAALPAHALEGTKRSLNAEGAHAARLAADVAWNARHMTAEGLQAALRRA